MFGTALVLLATAFYLPLTLLAPLRSVDATTQQPPVPQAAQPSLSLPDYGVAAVGAVGYPGVLASSGPSEPQPIASITKVITALTVLDAMPLQPGDAGPSITFGDADVGYYDRLLAEGGSVTPVRSGQVLSQQATLQIMLIESANNYAESLATWAFGSLDGYLAAAGAWLQANGLTATTIVDPTGMSPGNVSTAADLVALAKLAIGDPVIADIVNKPTLDVAGFGAVENTNSLLGVNGVDGIKTGTLPEAGSCLLFATDYQAAGESITIVGVVLGGPDRGTINATIDRLISEVDAGFAAVDLVTTGQVLAEYTTAWGDTANAVAAQTATVALWGASPVSAAVELQPVTVADAGTKVGTVTYTFAERTETVDLVLDRTIDDPGPWWRLTNPGELF